MQKRTIIRVAAKHGYFVVYGEVSVLRGELPMEMVWMQNDDTLPQIVSDVVWIEARKHFPENAHIFKLGQHTKHEANNVLLCQGIFCNLRKVMLVYVPGLMPPRFVNGPADRCPYCANSGFLIDVTTLSNPRRIYLCDMCRNYVIGPPLRVPPV